jgi:hypothetical protein
MLVVDINHRSPSAAAASTALVRCGLAVIAVAFLDGMIHAIGIGWTFAFVGGPCLAALGLFGVEYFRGMEWRREAFNSLFSTQVEQNFTKKKKKGGKQKTRFLRDYIHKTIINSCLI